MHAHDGETDHGLLRRIRGISLANSAIGTVEFIAGIATNSSTLTMAGVHDVSDGALYNMKHQAACEKDHERKQLLRKRGAMALIGVAVTVGGYEITQDVTDPHHQPEAAAAGIAVMAAGANIAAAGVLYRRRHQHEAHDSWKHVAGVDLPGSFITLVATPLSVKYPEVDIVGTAAHMGLAIAVGASTLRSINRE
jgi:divalent metal cation (Fe/Co/Zn/Cd) transporter